MRRILILTLCLFVMGTVNAQVFNTGSTLKPNTFSMGIEPSVIISGDANFMLFLHGGYGIKSGIDLGVTVGVLGSDNYFGADVEFAVGKNMSLAFGAHNFGSFGLDGTFLFTFPIRGDIRIFSGADLDVNFGNSTNFLLWIPLGVEVGLRKNMSFIFEAEIGLTPPAYHLIGGGVNFYF
jgi:hypothetical protein